jgi:hypothetical protein
MRLDVFHSISAGGWSTIALCMAFWFAGWIVNEMSKRTPKKKTGTMPCTGVVVVDKLTLSSQSPTLLLDVLELLQGLGFQLLSVTYKHGPPLVFSAEVSGKVGMTEDDVKAVVEKLNKQAARLAGISKQPE